MKLLKTTVSPVEMAAWSCYEDSVRGGGLLKRLDSKPCLLLERTTSVYRVALMFFVRL